MKTNGVMKCVGKYEEDGNLIQKTPGTPTKALEKNIIDFPLIKKLSCQDYINKQVRNIYLLQQTD